jgi:hypothetical protein
MINFHFDLQKLKEIITKFPIPALAIVFFITELVINPIGNFPLNDDWWYADLYKKLFEEHVREKVAWGATSLWGQLALTKPFVFIFGYSYTSLRIFTLCLSLSAIIFLFRIFNDRLKVNTFYSFLLSILLMFNPLFLCLSNSYMSDVPFLFFVLGGIHFYFSFREHKKISSLITAIVFFSFGILTRQLILAFLLGIVITEIVATRKIHFPVVLLLIIPLVILFIFELWMQTKVYNVIYTYVFFRTQPMLNRIPMIEAFENIFKRWIHFCSHTGFVLFPVLIPYLFFYFKRPGLKFPNREFIIAFVLFIPVCISLNKFPLGNYIFNFGLGPDTLYDVFTPEWGKSLESPALFTLMRILTYIASFGALLAFVNFISVRISNFTKETIAQNYFAFVFLSSMICYHLFLCFTSGIFDRYSLPVTLMIFLIIYDQLLPVLSKKYFFSMLFILLALYSTLGTKDYLNSMRARWEVVSLIKEKYHVTDKEINAGYEHEGSCFPETEDWYPKWVNTKPNLYMVSRQNIKNYHKLGSYAYQQYMPLRTDTIFYLKSDTITTK